MADEDQNTPKKVVTETPKLAVGLREAADMLSISYPTIFRLVQRKKLRTIKVLRTHLVPLDQIKAFLKCS